MLLQVQNPFFSFEPYTKEKHRMISATKKLCSSFHTYDRAVEVNIRILKNKYPSKQENELRQILQQLQNNIETVMNIFDEEKIQIQKPNPIQILEVEQEYHQNQNNISSKQYNQQTNYKEELKVEQAPQKQTIMSQNKLLKRSYYKLYNKMQKMRKDLELKQQQLQMAQIQIKKLQTANELLMEDKIKQQDRDRDQLSDARIY